MNEIPELPAYGFDPTSVSGLLSLAITVLLPVLVGLVTRQRTSPGVQGFLLLVFAAVKSFLEAWLEAENEGTPFLWTALAATIAVNFVIAVAVHFGLWKPTGVAAGAQRAFTSDVRR